MRVRFFPPSGASEIFETQAATYTECLAKVLDKLGYTPQKVDRFNEQQIRQNKADATPFTALVYAIGNDRSRTRLGEFEGFAANFEDVKQQALDSFSESRDGSSKCRLDVYVDWHEQSK